MMKKLFAVLLAAVLLTVSCAGAFAVSVGDTVISNSNTNANVDFGNGFYGMCLDNGLKFARVGDSFTVHSAEGNTLSNTNNSDISNQIKLLFTEYFNYFFANIDALWPYGYVDSNTGMRARDSGGDLQNAIWVLTDNYTGETKEEVLDIVNAVRALDSQKHIPDHGYVQTYTATSTNENGKSQTVHVTFDFYMLTPNQLVNGEEQQSFFMYKVAIADASATDSPIITPTPAPTDTPTPTPTPTDTPTPTPTPTDTPTPTPTPMDTPTPTPTPTDTPTPTPVVPVGPDDGSDEPPMVMPKTGDETNPVMLAVTFLMAFGMTYLLTRKKRRG